MPVITKKQIKLLRGLASKVFPKDEYYHAWLEQQFDVVSTKEMTVAQGVLAINLLLNDFPGGNKSPQKRYQGSGQAGQPGNLTPAQAYRIETLETALGWTDNPARLQGFLKKQTGKTQAVQMLSVKEAQKVITGLERIYKSNIPETK